MIRTARQSGFSMIEVLVTVVVISIGLLGQAAVMARSAQSNKTALMRSQATMLAYDILERMRLNRAGVLAGNYEFTLGSAAPTTTTPVYNFELKTWLNNVASSLPNGQGGIAVSTSDGGIDYLITITIVWDEITNGANGPATSSFTTTSAL